VIALYIRTSTEGQASDRQIAGLKELVGDRPHRVYQDKGVSGLLPFNERPMAKRLLADVAKGEVTEVWGWEVSRFGRSVKDLTAVLHGLAEDGVQVRIHKEGIVLLDETTRSINPVSALILAVLAAVSAMEMEQRSLRQREGIAQRKIRGGYTGRAAGSVEPPHRFLSKPRNKRIAQMIAQGHRVSHISSIVGCSPALVRKVRGFVEASGVAA
jgi:DNA invertase Pin-like site-specific DNA recombinase